MNRTKKRGLTKGKPMIQTSILAYKNMQRYSISAYFFLYYAGVALLSVVAFGSSAVSFDG